MPKNKIQTYVNGKGLVSIKVAPNQKVIEIHKVNPKGYILDIQTNKTAMQELSPQAYMLYMHFVLNLPGYKEALSLKNITDSTTLSERTYYKAINELIEKGYLVKESNPDFKDFYGFYESVSVSSSSSCEASPSSS